MDARVLERSRVARSALEALYASLRARGMGAPRAAEGQLIRPLLSLAGAEALGIEQDARFWSAAAAVQLAHEASLLHDDVIDEAATRRSEPTVAAARGVAVALVEGDHLLTTAYRLAAASESVPFLAAFSHAVERTVAGEKLQGRATGLELDEQAYRRIISLKSGELLGCALAAGAYAADHASAPSLHVLGRRMGELYQMLDDLLDYCPDADTGKAPLADYRQRRWTWPLLELGVADFCDDAEEVALRLTAVDAHGSSPLRRCLARFDREVESVRAGIAVLMPHDLIASQLVTAWRERALFAVRRVEDAAAERRTRAELMRLLPEAAGLDAFFRTHSRTFSLAARAFPRAFRDRVTAVYAFCRVTDDIADGSADGVGGGAAARERRLELWRTLARDAYDGGDVGIDLLQRVMSDARAAGVPFTVVDELIEGMRMDLRGERYATLPALRLYTYRVAGVIGRWLTQLAGVHDEEVLERAADLGHALQLTNIVRDVGDDLRMGRLYLPADMLAAAGIDEAALRALADGAPIPGHYRALLEAVMDAADEHYARALAATASLPPRFRHAVRIAAHVYRGIHAEVRAAGHDNLTRRARTSGVTKLRLALRALVPPRAAVPRRALPAAPRRPVRRARAAVLLLLAVVVTASFAATAAAQPLGTAAHAEVVRARAADAPSDMAARLDLVRALYFLAVDDPAAVSRGHRAVADARRALAPLPPDAAALLQAYEGALTALEARHGTWPHAQLRAVRRGLQLLDAAAAAAPADLEIRYLRALNGYHLPTLFGRTGVAREDIALLVRRLPHCTQQHPVELCRLMLAFVLDHGAPDADEAAALRAAECS